MRALFLFMILPALLGTQRDQRREGDLRVGDTAPDFKLKLLKSKDTFKLSDNFGKRPTVLIFGSYT